MQPISDIIKEVGLLAWLFWGISAFIMTMAIVGAVQIKKSSKIKSWLSVLPIPSIGCFFVMMGMILYCANDSVKRQKKSNQRMAMYQGEQMAKFTSPPMEEKTTITLDQRLQSIEGVIGYLDQSIKMGKEPKDLAPIILVLAKEIKNVRDGN